MKFIAIFKYSLRSLYLIPANTRMPVYKPCNMFTFAWMKGGTETKTQPNNINDVIKWNELRSFFFSRWSHSKIQTFAIILNLPHFSCIFISFVFWLLLLWKCSGQQHHLYARDHSTIWKQNAFAHVGRGQIVYSGLFTAISLGIFSYYLNRRFN